MKSQNIFVARQPIFDHKLEVVAYELLFRDSQENMSQISDGNQATLKVITNTLLNIGMDVMTRGKQVYVNFTRDLLLDGSAKLMPKKHSVIEILETVKVDKELISACRQLRKEGYSLALDDFVDGKGYAELMDFIDIIKVDFMGTTPQARKKLVAGVSDKKKTLLAEKVETHQDLKEAVELGCRYFQGYFFSKPVVVAGKEIHSSKVSYLQLIHAIAQPSIDFEEMASIIKRDASLSTKLLKYINVAAFPWRHRIDSLNHALTLLGISQIRRWISLVAISGMSKNKPDEIALMSVIRGRFCELLGKETGRNRYAEFDYFLLGMLSLMDALLDRPLEETIAQIPLRREVKAALLGEQNEFRDLLDTVIHYERADWEALENNGAVEGNGQDISDIYLQAVQWSQELLRTGAKL